MTQAPTPGPLSADDVKLLVKGDYVRGPNGKIYRLEEWGDGGFLTFIDEPHDGYIATLCAFIGRPDADGWMPWSGGNNPVPGQTVDFRLRDGTEGAGRRADDYAWEHEGGLGDIIAFRLAPTAPVEASGSERDDRPLVERLEGWALHHANGTTRQLLAEAAAALRPQPSGETRERLTADLRRQAKASTDPLLASLALEAADALIRPAPVASGGQHSSGEGCEPRKVSAFPVEGDPVQQMTGLTVAEALDDPASSLEIMRALTTSRTLCVWADGAYRVMPTMDVPTARNEEGTLIGVIPMEEIGEVHEAPVTETAGEAVAWRRRPIKETTGSGKEWVLYGPEDAAHYNAATDRYVIQALGIIGPVPAQDDDKLRIADADAKWLTRLLDDQKEGGHCGEGNVERRERSIWNDRIDRIRAFLVRNGKGEG